MATKLISIRLDDVHFALLERMIEKLDKKGVETNKTDVIEKAIYYFAREIVLGTEEVSEIIDQFYSGIYKDLC